MAQVNYFKIMNRFWDKAPYVAGYKGDHSALFFAILDSINRNGWRETEIEFDRIVNKVRMGKVNYLGSRQWLDDNQFITFKKGMGDYQKAKFWLGYAVLSDTAIRTADKPLKDTTAVPDRTAPRTASDTADSETAVLSGTASRTADDTYLIKEQITTNLKQQQQQETVPDAVVAAVVVESEIVPLGEENKKKETPPQPLPTADEVRAELLASAPHKRYVVERLKMVTTADQYAELVEIYIDQQEMKYDPNKPIKPMFDEMSQTRKHFMNWLGERHTRLSNPTSKTTNGSNNNFSKRTTGALRPSALGQPDFTGEGSPCDVEL